MREDVIIVDVDTNPFSSAEETNSRAVMPVQEMDDDDTEGSAASEEIPWDSFDTTKPGVLDLILGRMTDTPVRLDAGNNLWWYDGRRWLSLAKNEHGLTSRITPELRELRKKAFCLPKGADAQLEAMRKELLRSCKALLDNPGKIAKLLAYAACVQGPPLVLDKNPYLLNCLDAVVDLRTGDRLPHDPSLGLTGLAPVEYHPEAQCPKFVAVLEKVFMSNLELIRYFQQVIGYSMSGDTGAQLWWIYLGSRGQEGKSMLANVFRAMLGQDYAAEIGPRSLTGKSSVILDDIASQDGNRLVFCREPEKGMALNESLVKSLTGGDSIRARGHYEAFRDVKPALKLHMLTNFLPEINGDSRAAWRRVKVIPFDYRVPDGKRINGLDEILLSKEREGIFAWCVAGAVDYFKNGFAEPDAVTRATKQYRIQQRSVAKSNAFDPSRGLDFVRSALTKASEGDLSKADVYQAYEDDCYVQDIKPVSKKAFAKAMQHEGYEHPGVENHRIFDKAGRSIRAWHGVAYKASAAADIKLADNVTSIKVASKKSKRDVA